MLDIIGKRNLRDAGMKLNQLKDVPWVPEAAWLQGTQLSPGWHSACHPALGAIPTPSTKQQNPKFTEICWRNMCWTHSLPALFAHMVSSYAPHASLHQPMLICSLARA